MAIQNEEERNVKGMHLAMQRVEEAIQNKTSFVYETVLSHPSKLAKLVIVGTRNPLTKSVGVILFIT